MIVNYLFAEHMKVMIIPIKIRGRVLERSCGDVGIQYRVRYFKDRSPVSDWFFEDELDFYTDKSVGFLWKK